MKKIKLTEEDKKRLAKMALEHRYNIDGLHHAIETLQDEIYKVEDRLKYVLARYVDTQDLQEDISLGHWECETSPTGECAYGRDGSDFCLFCGGPDERK